MTTPYRTAAPRNPEPEHWLDVWERNQRRRLWRTGLICFASSIVTTMLMRLLLGWT